MIIHLIKIFVFLTLIQWEIGLLIYKPLLMEILTLPQKRNQNSPYHVDRNNKCGCIPVHANFQFHHVAFPLKSYAFLYSLFVLRLICAKRNG